MNATDALAGNGDRATRLGGRQDGDAPSSCVVRRVILAGAVAAILSSTALAGSISGPGQSRPIAPATTPRAIFGDDDRHELYAVSDPGLRVATEAVALLVDNSDLRCDTPGTLCDLGTRPLFDGKACANEPFASQPTAGFCTGFLIAPDLVATAGHCINALTCPFTAFVFGFAKPEQDEVATTEGLATYRCADVVESVARYEYDAGTFQDGADYALVRLDRLVDDRTPLAVRREPAVAVGDQLAIVGHPFALPLKVDDSAQVKSIASTFFEANLDASGGNSGSPVLDRASLEVVGILVRGWLTGGGVIDFEQHCVRSPRYSDADGALGSFPQSTHAALLPVVESCFGRPDCLPTATKATCASSSFPYVYVHSSSCLECASDRGRTKGLRRHVEKALRLLSDAQVTPIAQKAEKPLRRALANLERTAGPLEQLYARGRVSEPCHGALRSVIDEALAQVRLNLAVVDVLK